MAAASQDWIANGFHAFAGPAQLDGTFMARTENNGVVNTNADIVRFYRWIEVLRANLAPGAGQAVGIRDEYAESVQILLHDFFPPMGANDTWMPAVRIRSQNGDGQVAVESLVSFGTDDPRSLLQIVDGPTALGYIFSAAIPPNDATWLTYYLPLAALYCRCLYLAFIMDRDANLNALDAIADLPVMTCVMYNGANQNIRYVYGSTPANTLGASQAGGADRDNAGAMLDRFRLNTILGDAIQRVQPGGQIPRYPPRRITFLCDGLWPRLRATPEFELENQTLKDAVKTLQTSVIGIYEQLPAYPKGTLEALPLNRVYGKLREDLRNDMRVIIRDRFRNAATYDRNNLAPGIETAWAGIIKTYLRPHVYVKGTNFATAANDAASQALIDNTVNLALGNLWQGFRASFLAQLDDLWQQEVNKPDHTPFGRCAETYCVVGMQPYYFPNETMNHVRGISLQTLYVGGSASFQNGFGTPQLGNADPAGVYRLPCVNCQELLPLFGCITGPNDYDADIIAVPDKNRPAR